MAPEYGSLDSQYWYPYPTPMTRWHQPPLSYHPTAHNTTFAAPQYAHHHNHYSPRAHHGPEAAAAASQPHASPYFANRAELHDIPPPMTDPGYRHTTASYRPISPYYVNVQGPRPWSHSQPHGLAAASPYAWPPGVERGLTASFPRSSRDPSMGWNPTYIWHEQPRDDAPSHRPYEHERSPKRGRNKLRSHKKAASRAERRASSHRRPAAAADDDDDDDDDATHTRDSSPLARTVITPRHDRTHPQRRQDDEARSPFLTRALRRSAEKLSGYCAFKSPPLPPERRLRRRRPRTRTGSPERWDGGVGGDEVVLADREDDDDDEKPLVRSSETDRHHDNRRRRKHRRRSISYVEAFDSPSPSPPCPIAGRQRHDKGTWQRDYKTEQSGNDEPRQGRRVRPRRGNKAKTGKQHRRHSSSPEVLEEVVSSPAGGGVWDTSSPRSSSSWLMMVDQGDGDGDGDEGVLVSRMNGLLDIWDARDDPEWEAEAFALCDLERCGRCGRFYPPLRGTRRHVCREQ